MEFSELKKNLKDLLLSYVEELDSIDENENITVDEEENEVVIDGFDCIEETMELLCDDVYALLDDTVKEQIFVTCQEQCDDCQQECECTCKCQCDEKGNECCCCEDAEEEEEDEDIPFAGVHYVDDEDEYDNFLRGLYLLNDTIKIYDYDPIKNGIVINNVNIEPGFGGIQVLGEVTKIADHENEDEFVSINVVLYEADYDDGAIKVLRKETYDIDLETIDEYSVFDVEIDCDPDTLDRTSGVNIYLTR